MSDKSKEKGDKSTQETKPSQSGEGTPYATSPSLDAITKISEQERQLEQSLKEQRERYINPALLEQLKAVSSNITLSGISSGSIRFNNILLERIENQSRELQKAIVLSKEREVSRERERTIKEQNDTILQLKGRINFGFLLERIHKNAHDIVLNDETFRNKFLDKSPCKVFVMSIDIRQSTDLMLNARNPEDFSLFISTLCEEMKSIVISNYGIIDKFSKRSQGVKFISR